MKHFIALAALTMSGFVPTWAEEVWPTGIDWETMQIAA